MTVAWTTDPGGVFLVLGHIAAAIYNANGYRGTGSPAAGTTWTTTGTAIRGLNVAINNIIAGYSTAQQSYWDGVRDSQDTYLSAHDTFITDMVALAKTALVQIVQADNPQPDTADLTIMTELIRQMVGASQTVDACAVGSTVAAGGSNIGNPTVLCSVIGRYGATLEYAMAETLVGKVTSDSKGNGSGTATAGQEPIRFLGAAKLTNKFDANWPDGSGCDATINVVDPELDNSGGNLLTNSNFVTYTVANTPDNWTILVGAAGTNILKQITTTYNSSVASLQIAGQAATLTSIVQTFGTDTEGELLPSTVYAVNLKYYVDVQPVAGVLKIDLVDGSNAVITDDAGTDNTITLTVSGATATSWLSLSGFFRTPTNMPTTVKLRIRLSTAMTAGSNVFINYLAVTPATQLYVAGPYMAAFRGDTDVVFGDRWTNAVTNDRAGLIQQFFEQAFGMSDLGLILPSNSAGGESIADSLVA